MLSGSFPDDLDNQSMDNYEYDGAGNLTDDAQAGAAISWTPYGKVKEVQRSSQNQTVQYGYDAQQNRVLKKIIDTSTDGEIWTCYIRDAQGNVLAVYKQAADTITWVEQHLYGSSRLGILEPGVKWYTGSGTPDTPYFLDTAQLCIGWKRYEVTNHLGNVMAVLSDRKSYHDTNTDGDADYFDPVFLSATDYYPFGFEMPGRKYNFGGYRYGFNGKENDTDGEFSSLTHYDYGFRIYNPAIGRFLSVDPLAGNFPWNSPYSFTANMPIAGIDPDGRYIIILAVEGKGGRLLKSQLEAFFDGNVSVSYTTGAEARLKLTRTGELTERQKYLFNTLNQMAEDDSRGIKIRISTDDPWVPFETYDSRQIDPADFEELPETGSTRTQGGWYAHFFTEQWYRQVELGITEALEFKEGQSSGFIKSHTDALYHEYRATGVVTTDVSEETLEDGSRLIRFASFDKDKNFVGGFNILENNMGEISRQMNNTPIKIQELNPLQREAVKSVYERIGNDEKN